MQPGGFLDFLGFGFLGSLVFLGFCKKAELDEFWSF